MWKIVLRRLLSGALVSVGVVLVYVGIWVVSQEIWPQVRTSGWSLSGSSLILNRQWEGNEHYLLVFLYFAAGVGTLLGGLWLWRAGRKPRGSHR